MFNNNNNNNKTLLLINLCFQALINNTQNKHDTLVKEHKFNRIIYI